MNPYIVINISCCPKILSETFSISTPVGYSVIARRVYRNYPVIIFYKVTSVDFVDLDMIDFNIILVMDWLHSYNVSIDYRDGVV